MDPDSSHLQHEHQHESEQIQREVESTPIELASVEELLRYDAGQISVPPAVREKISDSLAREPNHSRSWWRRFFSASD
jgi:hypothetical protein